MADWRHLAACRGHDPELWFPVGSTGPALIQAAAAKAVCARCPVREECLWDALRMPGPVYGIWGGLDEEQITTLKRQLARQNQEKKAMPA